MCNKGETTGGGKWEKRGVKKITSLREVPHFGEATFASPLPPPPPPRHDVHGDEDVEEGGAEQDEAEEAEEGEGVDDERAAVDAILPTAAADGRVRGRVGVGVGGGVFGLGPVGISLVVGVVGGGGVAVVVGSEHFPTCGTGAEGLDRTEISGFEDNGDMDHKD